MTFVTDDSGADDIDEFVTLRSRMWRAAAPYLLAAVACWGGATISLVTLMHSYQSPQFDQNGGQPSVTKTSILQSMNQILTWAGAAFLVVGLLVLALRQHERWRRDLDLSLDTAMLDGLDEVAVSPIVTAPIVPAYAQSVWDETSVRREH
ncbi:MAG: hypothetical protein JWM93_1649 [Frankiales bacterium]|nr:hypothetical protein [Frankiales bacterium]